MAGAMDTMHDIDERYHKAETDATLEIIPEKFGTRRIGVAIVGVGRMGAIHLYNVLREPRAKLLYVLDFSQDRLGHFRRKYYLDEQNVKVLHTDQWQQVLDDPQVEAVLIATPTFTHEHYARSALEHGKHVLCEKPLAEKVQAVEAVARLADTKGLKLICAFNRRYDNSFRMLKSQLARGDVGEARIIKTCSRDSPLPPLAYIKISGGIFHDCAVHDIDVVLWLAEQLPSQVQAFGHTYDDGYKALDDFDTVLINMKFKSGLLACTDLSRVSATGYEQRVEVMGPKGVLKIDELATGGWEKHTEHGLTKPSQNYSFASRFEVAYANEIAEFFNHIEGNHTLYPIRPGYLPVLCKIIDAIEHSARTGQIVELQWSPEEEALVK